MWSSWLSLWQVHVHCKELPFMQLDWDFWMHMGWCCLCLTIVVVFLCRWILFQYFFYLFLPSYFLCYIHVIFHDLKCLIFMNRTLPFFCLYVCDIKKACEEQEIGLISFMIISNCYFIFIYYSYCKNLWQYLNAFSRVSQSELHQQLEGLSVELTRVQEQTQCPLQLDAYIKKLQNAKRRVVVVNNILQNTQVGVDSVMM